MTIECRLGVSGERMARMKRARIKSKAREDIKRYWTTAELRRKTLAPVMKELQLAHKRINTSPISRLQWLIDLSYEDLSSLSAGQLSDREWDMVIFGVEVKPEDLLLLENKIAIIKYDFLSKDRHLLLADFQKLLEIKINRLLAGEPWKHTFPKITKTISLSGSEEGDETARVDIDPGTWLLGTAFTLAKAERPRLHRCANPSCEKLFIEKRKGRARFCSRKCSAYIRVKNWRKEQRDNH